MANDLTFNEFQRELRKRNIEPHTAYMLTMLYERMGELTKQLDEMAGMLLTYANQLEGFVQLRVADQQFLRGIKRRLDGNGGSSVEGVGVESVANEPKE